MKVKRLLKRFGKQNALKSSKRGVLAGNSKDCSQVVIPLGDDAELILHLEYDENDEALQEAARIFDEYKRGEGKLYDTDFLELDKVVKKQEVSDSVCLLPDGFDFYTEIEEVYQGEKLYACNIYVWCGETSDIKNIENNENVSEENGFIVRTKKVAYTSHFEKEIDLWIENFFTKTLANTGIYCHIEYLC